MNKQKTRRSEIVAYVKSLIESFPPNEPTPKQELIAAKIKHKFNLEKNPTNGTITKYAQDAGYSFNKSKQKYFPLPYIGINMDVVEISDHPNITIIKVLPTDDLALIDEINNDFKEDILYIDTKSASQNAVDKRTTLIIYSKVWNLKEALLKRIELNTERREQEEASEASLSE